MASSDGGPPTSLTALPLDRTVIVFDLAWTVREGASGSPGSGADEDREIVEIGAVRLDGSGGLAETAMFDVLIRPARYTIVSADFTRRTGISQTLIDNDAVPFAEALMLFEAFAGDTAPLLGFGEGPTVLRHNCGLNRLPCPFEGERLVDALPAIAAAARRPPGSFLASDLPGIFGFPPTDFGRSAIGDARCIAVALRHIAGAGAR